MDTLKNQRPQKNKNKKQERKKKGGKRKKTTDVKLVVCWPHGPPGDGGVTKAI